MEKFPICWAGKSVGELTAAREGLYTRYSVTCHLPGDGLWCVWAVGDRGELRIGVPEPKGECAVISRSFSENGLRSLGTLQSVILRPVGEENGGVPWTPVNRPEDWFRTPWLCGQLRNLRGVLAVREGKNRRLAIPYDREKPFPLTQLFCLARIAQLERGTYVIYTFDEREMPILWKPGAA